MRTDVNGSVPVRTAPRGLMFTKIALGAALTLSLAGFAGVSPVGAQDDEIVLGGNGGSTLTVSPGHASAQSAVASAEAGPGWAVTEAAAARAMADSDCGAMTEGSTPSWETSAVAMPDIGAEVDAAIAKAKATREETAAGTDVEDAGLKAKFEDCFDKEEREVKPPKEEVVYEVPVYEEVPVVVEEVPSTGAGAAQAGLAGLMGAAAAAAAFGAVALRRREDAASVSAR
jgi:hypothetical protein